MAKRKTHDEFINEINMINPNVVVNEKYITAKTKMECSCMICGYKWITDPDHLLRGRGCPVCSGRKKKEYDDFIRELHDINPNIKVEGNYVNNKTNTSLTCMVCGHRWEATPHNLLRGTGCAKCAGNVKKSHEEFVEEMKVVNCNIRIDESYINAKTKIKCTCKICGFNWYAKPNGLLQGQSCPSCTFVKSRGEQKIQEYLDNKGLRYETQKQFDGLIGRNRRLSYDFYINEENLLIEFQGKQHYCPVPRFGGNDNFLKQQEYDNKKRKYAKDKGIKLLEISYKDYNDIESILGSELGYDSLNGVTN